MTDANDRPEREGPHGSFDRLDARVPEPALAEIATALADRFVGVFAPETVERYVFESYTALHRTATITSFLVPLAQRFAADRLTALAQATGAVAKDRCEVLFVCVHNAGRSQMAAALTQHRGAGRVHVRSAGSVPAADVEVAVVQVMAEIGADVTMEFPKPLTDDVVQAADIVITMGCGDACPVYPGKRYLDWDLPDPESQPLERVRAIRDDIDVRVQALLAELIAAPAGTT